MKFYKLYPSVKQCWDGNTVNAYDHRDWYFDDINFFCQRRKPELFRYHVAGDIIDQDYLEDMSSVARLNPETRFLAYTKRHNLDYRNIPHNLKIVFSYWPGWGQTEFGDYRDNFPRAWMQDGTEDRVGQNDVPYLVCPGVTEGKHCDQCKACWRLDAGPVPLDVVFPKH